MKISFTRYLNRRGLTIAAVMVFVGVIDLFEAYRRRDLSDAIVVVVIFFIAMPMFALWRNRTASARPETKTE